METDATLQCTANGQVTAETVVTGFDFTREKSLRLATARTGLRGRALHGALTDALKLPPREGISDYRWPLSSLVPGALTRFDLPDCYRELESKSLQQSDPVGAGGVQA